MSSDRLSKALEFAVSITARVNMQAAEAELKDFVAAFGFDTYVIAAFTGPGSLKDPYVLATAWDAAWTEKYLREHYILDDPVIARAARTALPFFYHEALEAPGISDRAHKIREEARAYSLTDGVFIPVYGPSGFEGCLSLGGDTEHLTASDLKALHIAGVYAYQHFFRLIKNGVDTSDTGAVLTKRETECLKWSAAGKTSTDIADVLGISRHTADWYLKEATRKLGAANRTHAVAIAFRLGLVA
ncbi:LuxR family quorum sensing-dependent transcriptional regulator [Roseibium hamelinense]|uniref:LuxR family quorum sensing-dependent transcriptional regulator n=1 Tax=Roseibium hamelinense TaxID=150831 RepID=A0A562SML2_9HYPH|nr:LuxR family transcriptional regulator [Roseibium hamelinense]MTI43475.1 LuxR family transcriptional regulator [Roseibium hamelinense]TWI81936.1 LuxR family quorum sensing-dependent transcriptional regulator [Roseibium hamelinense]